MTPNARAAFLAYTTSLAALSGYGPDACAQGFTVDPTVQQKLETKVQESSAFLRRINIMPVTEMKGEKLGMGISGPIASRTDTSAANSQGRKPVDPTGLTKDGYECRKTDSDTFVKYAKLDTWAKFPDFQQRMRNLVIERQALDRIMIGFNGTSAAATTDRVANPLLQDVNIGWFEKIRQNAPSHYFHEVEAASGVIKVGQGGDYGNLDALVMDALELMPAWARLDTGLECFTSHDLMHDQYFPLVNVNQAPTEQIAAGQIMSQKRMGGKPVSEAPFLPPNSILITRPDNLSIYWQEGGRRSRVIDNPQFDRIDTFESSNDDYVVEDYDYAVLIQGINTDPESW
ncbi:MAG: phage major capsid protein, P2 family [Caulobacter sp.]|nr:phage major capsid protein, P2 family [Caulobacter sp.]